MTFIPLAALFALGAGVTAIAAQTSEVTDRAAQPSLRPEIRLLTIDGVINPFTARYLERELDRAAAAGAAAVVLRLDTPGHSQRRYAPVSRGLLTRGSVSVKHDPTPSVLSTVRSPFIARARSRLMANPSPTPPSRRESASFS